MSTVTINPEIRLANSSALERISFIRSCSFLNSNSNTFMFPGVTSIARPWGNK